MKHQCKYAFTLIELVVVILIIGILAAIALPQYQTAMLKSRYSTLMPVARSVKDAEEAAYQERGNYTTELSYLYAKLPEDLNQEGGPSAQIVSNAEKSYVKFSRQDLNNNYVMYFAKSSTTPQAIHCEALKDNEQAKKICLSFGANPEPIEATDPTYDAYILEKGGESVPPTTQPDDGDQPDEPCDSCECNPNQAKCCAADEIWNGMSCETQQNPPPSEPDEPECGDPEDCAGGYWNDKCYCVKCGEGTQLNADGTGCEPTLVIEDCASQGQVYRCGKGGEGIWMEDNCRCYSCDTYSIVYGYTGTTSTGRMEDCQELDRSDCADIASEVAKCASQGKYVSGKVWKGCSCNDCSILSAFGYTGTTSTGLSEDCQKHNKTSCADVPSETAKCASQGKYVNGYVEDGCSCHDCSELSVMGYTGTTSTGLSADCEKLQPKESLESCGAKGLIYIGGLQDKCVPCSNFYPGEGTTSTGYAGDCTNCPK